MRKNNEIADTIIKLVSLLKLHINKKQLLLLLAALASTQNKKTITPFLIADKKPHQRLLEQKSDVINRRRQEVIKELRELIADHNSRASVRLFLPRQAFEKAHEEFRLKKSSLLARLDALKASESEPSSITM